MSQAGNRHRRFPMFIESEGKQVLVIGGGAVAERRVRTMTEFGFEITLISDSLTEGLQAMADDGAFLYVRGRCFVDEKPADSEQHWIGLFPADMILACTDDRTVNRQIGEFARRRRIPVNVCDAQEESTFWFPAVALNQELTMGLVGTGEDHRIVRKAAAKLRQVIEEREYEK